MSRRGLIFCLAVLALLENHALAESWINTRAGHSWPPEPKACVKVWSSSDLVVRTDFRYDQMGRIASRRTTRTSKGRPVEAEAPTECTYVDRTKTCKTQKSSVEEIADPQGRVGERRSDYRAEGGKSFAATLAYDSQGVEKEPKTRRAYDDHGRLIEERRENRIERFTYDSQGRRATKQIFAPSTPRRPVEVIEYVWNGSRLVASIDRSMGGLRTQLTTFAHDVHGRQILEVSLEVMPGSGATLESTTTYSYECFPGGKSPGLIDCQRFGDCP
jgi:YD repeat-containing protein